MGSLKVFEKFTEDHPDRRREPDDVIRRNRELALSENGFEMRRHADVTLRLQQISTMLIREGNNGSLYEHVLDDAVDLMSADLGSMQLFHPERGELLVLHTDAEVLQQAAGSAVLAAAASILESIACNLRDAVRRSSLQ
jgi:hypothetical protein